MANAPAHTEITVQIASDRLTASVLIPAGYDRSLVSTEALSELAHAAGVVIDAPELARLEAICVAYQDDPSEVDAVFAEAALPESCGEPACVWDERFDPAIEPAVEAADGVDHYITNSLRLVRAGDVVATIHELQDEREGRDVLGNTIPVPRCKDGSIEFDPASFSSGIDGTRVALLDGVLRCGNGTYAIDEVLEVRGNVDFHTGNIDTQGSVLVSGDVKDRFTVTAAKNIEVRGLVEAASLVAGGDALLHKGMTGREIGALRVAGNLEVGFLGETTAEVLGNVLVRREIMACTVTIGGDLIGPRSAIIGGSVSVGGSIDIGKLGSPSEPPTLLRVGCLLMLEAELKEAKHHAHKLERTLTSLIAEEEKLKAMPADMSTQLTERRKAVELQRTEATLHLTAAIDHITELEDQQASRVRVDLVVRTAIYPRVTIETESYSVTVPVPIKGPVAFGWSKDRRLMMHRLDGHWCDTQAIVRRAA